MNDKHPMQPLVWDGNVIRFKENKIVRFLIDAGPFDMNQLKIMPFDNGDRTQFAQLIGYSVDGFGDLSYAYPSVVARADMQAKSMIEKAKQ